MKIPNIFVPERDLEKKLKQLMQYREDDMIIPGGIVIDGGVFKFKENIFRELEQIILDKVIDKNKEQYIIDLKNSKILYKEKIKGYILKNLKAVK